MKNIYILTLFLLASCAGSNYEAYRDCHYELGPNPEHVAAAFGLIGTGILAATDSEDRDNWKDKFNTCVTQKIAQNNATP
jgi:hypothetical protein